MILRRSLRGGSRVTGQPPWRGRPLSALPCAAHSQDEDALVTLARPKEAEALVALEAGRDAVGAAAGARGRAAASSGGDQPGAPGGL